LATFQDLEKMKYAVIEEYGIRLRDCLDRTGGQVCDAIISFVMKNYNELPRPMEGLIRDGIAEYVDVNRNTFQTQLTNAYKYADARKRHESKSHNTIKEPQSETDNIPKNKEGSTVILINNPALKGRGMLFW
jgi:hypothetical protein